MDEGSCGPRGDDAQADLSQCVNGADVVYSEPFEGYITKATVIIFPSMSMHVRKVT